MTDKIVQEARERYKLAEEAWSEVYDAALDDIKFARLGEQWDDEILKQRARENRPALTINRLPSFIRQVVNDARQSKPSIKIHPVDSISDIETAEILSDLIRSIEYTSDAQVAYDTAIDSAASCGFGFFRINTAYAHDDSFDLDLRIERIANPLSVVFDPTSMAADSSDWEYCFVTEMLTKAQFEARYPDAEASSWDGEADDTWLTEDLVRVAEYWQREQVKRTILRLSDGTILPEKRYLDHKDLFDVAGITVAGTRDTLTYRVRQYMLSGAEQLNDTIEWSGRYIPIIPVYGEEVVVEGKRYFRSLIRDARDAQKMFNYWRTTSTELVALAPKAPWIGPRGAFSTDSDKWATASTEAHAYIEYDGPVPPHREPFAGVPAGALQEALNASDDIKSIMGLYDASLGARSNETSGKAILARQREGDVSTFHFQDNLARAIRHAGRVLIDLIPSVYSSPRVLRVMGADQSERSVTVNEQYERGGMAKLHDLTTGKYDVTVDVGPSFTTRRQEAADQMVSIIQAYPDIAPIVGDLLAKNLDWPDAEEIAKRLKVMLPPQLQKLEEMDGVPPQAQAALAAANAQMEQMQQLIQQGQQVLAEQQQKIQALEMDRHNRAAETDAKLREIEARYRADIAKAQADVRVAEIQAESEGDVARVEAAVQMIEARLETTVEQIKASVEASVKAPPPARRMRLTAPSGGVYEGTLAGGTVVVKAPSGAVFTGEMTQ